MTDHLRFAALAGALFVLSYSGVTWAIAGAPVPALSRVVSHGAPDTRVAVLAPQPPQAPQAAVAAKLPPDSAIPYRDRLRLAAYQASTEYAQAPCGTTAKAKLIEAVSAYAQAWHD